MSELANRSSRRRMSQQNARSALRRIRAELYAVIQASAEAQENGPAADFAGHIVDHALEVVARLYPKDRR